MADPYSGSEVSGYERGVPLEGIRSYDKLQAVVGFLAHSGYHDLGLASTEGRVSFVKKLTRVAPESELIDSLETVAVSAAERPEPIELLAATAYQLLVLQIVDWAPEDESYSPYQDRLMGMVDGLAWVATGDYWRESTGDEPQSEAIVVPREYTDELHDQALGTLQAGKESTGLFVAVTCLADLAIGMAEKYPIDPHHIRYRSEAFIQWLVNAETYEARAFSGGRQTKTTSGVVIADESIDRLLNPVIPEPNERKLFGWLRRRGSQ